MGPGRSPAGLLLDRGAELGAIAAAVASACSGAGSVLLVEGAAGIGKTTLLASAWDRAANAGMTVLAARGAEFEDGYAWGVVRQLFEARIRAGGGPGLAGDAVTLAALALSGGPGGGEEDSFAVLHGLYWLTADLAQQAPLLLAVDDLHWADQPSQRFVAHLAARLEGLAVLLVLTVREPRSGTAQDKALIAGLAAGPGVIVLRPAALSAAACAELVAGMLGVQVSPAFQQACRELTGGNPLLLRGLLDGLAAEGMTGTDAEVPHLRRLTPESVARRVLLQLGRMPAAALAAARAIAVLGSAATAERAARLAGLDSDACAEAVGALMAEGLAEGEQTVWFVHPLVRSAIYQDLTPPVRQRWHKRAARMLDEQDAAPEEVTVHLMAAAASGDGWVVDRLRAAAADARGRGAPDVAIGCLERALAEPPSASVRGEVLFELGSAQTFRAPAAAVENLTEALTRSKGWPGRGEIALALGRALALCGRFADAVGVLQQVLAGRGEDRSAAADRLQADLLNAARWDLQTRPVIWPVLDRLQARAGAGEDLDPQLHANLAIELAAAGVQRDRAIQHARAALRSMPELMSRTPTALAEAVTVLLYADMAGDARDAAQAWLRLAQQRGWLLSSCLAASVASYIALHEGDVRQTLAYGQQAAAGGEWISVITTAFMVVALIDQGAADQAHDVLETGGLGGQLGATWPYTVVQWARGCLHAAAGDHAAAVADLLAAGELVTRWGMRNPASIPWRSDAALSLAALGDRREARRLCAEEIGIARQWGSCRSLGIALRAAGLVEGRDRGIELLTEAVSVLRRSPARLELARALLDLGAAHRRAGARTRARECLRESLDLGHALGGLALAGRARQELVAAGGRPRRDAISGRDALTPSELRVAQLAADGHTNRQIAQALFVTQRTVENHLTSTYGKLGISSRPELPAALAGSPRRSAARQVGFFPPEDHA
jgi:DNA-binding CsgD family transcriptional regulator